MAEIKDCIGKNVKISKGSITIKAEDGKTCGVVRNIVSLYDMQANKKHIMQCYMIYRELHKFQQRNLNILKKILWNLSE